MYRPSPQKLKDTVITAFSIKEDTASNEEIRNRLFSAGKVTGTNLCMMVCAIVIACVGLNSGTMTVVVGAMLIEPLMGSILILAYSGVTSDPDMLKSHGLGFLFQILTSILASTVYFLFSPVKAAAPELLAMTQPTLFDVIVAVVGGTAGVIGQTRKDRVNTIIPGVAIATTLMPPLCTCGYSIANMKWGMLLGALYLFIINAYFICMGASIVLSLFNIPRVDEMTEEEWEKDKKAMIRNTALILLPAVIAAVIRLI